MYPLSTFKVSQRIPGRVTRLDPSTRPGSPVDSTHRHDGASRETRGGGEGRSDIGVDGPKDCRSPGTVERRFYNGVLSGLHDPKPRGVREENLFTEDTEGSLGDFGRSMNLSEKSTHTAEYGH